MLLTRRYRAPAGDGDVLADPPLEQVEFLLERAKTFGLPGRPFSGLSLSDLRDLARREVTELAQRYHQSLGEPVPQTESNTWIVAGHQPDLFHPGVWLKNFVLAGLVRDHRATALNLIVDNDAAEFAAVRVPRRVPPDSASVVAVPFDRPPGGLPFEDWSIQDEAMFRSFPDRLRESTGGWPYEPLAFSFWREAVANGGRAPNGISLRFALARRALERGLGVHNRELPVSWLCRSRAFSHFTGAIIDGLTTFRNVYNSAVRSYRARNGIRSRVHPVPELGCDGDWCESPFWIWRAGEPRRRLFVRSMGGTVHLRAGPEAAGSWPPEPGWKIRPRALTLTLFARLALADLFVHGIGGAKYDELTDAISADFFGAPPPPFLTVSGTLRLPLPHNSFDPQGVNRLQRRKRDLAWNPHRYLDGHPLVEERETLIRQQPTTRSGRRQRFAALRANLDVLRPEVAAEIAKTQAELELLESAERINSVFGSREYAFILYSERQLRNWFESVAGQPIGR